MSSLCHLLHETQPPLGPAHGLVKNTTMCGFASCLKLSQHDPMRSIHRTVANQRIMNPEIAQTEEQARLQLPMWDTDVDENETRYKTKLDIYQQDDGLANSHRTKSD